MVDLLGEQYKVLKLATQKYLDKDYVRYGKLKSIDETSDVGTAAFTISNGVMISGVLRPYQVSSWTYYIVPSQQQPYYVITKK